jgi:Na+/H+-translocating membrane pyrophosphatase
MDLILAALQPATPVIVKIVEPEPRDWTDLIYGAFGLAGIMFLAAIVLGIVVAGVMFAIRSRNPLSH